MELEYRIFEKGFNKVLELVSVWDEEVAKRFKSLVRIMPNSVTRKTYKCQDILIDNDVYNFEMLRTENSLNIDYIIKGEKFLKTEVYIRRIFEEDLLKEDFDIELFSIYQRNTSKRPPRIMFDGSDNYLNMLTNQDGSKEIKYTIGLKGVGDYFFLYKKTNIKGVEVLEGLAMLECVELFDYLETEDEYEEELEVYMDLDDDFNNKLNGN